MAKSREPIYWQRPVAHPVNRKLEKLERERVENCVKPWVRCHHLWMRTLVDCEKLCKFGYNLMHRLIQCLFHPSSIWPSAWNAEWSTGESLTGGIKSPLGGADGRYGLPSNFRHVFKPSMKNFQSRRDCVAWMWIRSCKSRKCLSGLRLLQGTERTSLGTVRQSSVDKCGRHRAPNILIPHSHLTCIWQYSYYAQRTTSRDERAVV